MLDSFCPITDLVAPYSLLLQGSTDERISRIFPRSKLTKVETTTKSSSRGGGGGGASGAGERSQVSPKLCKKIKSRANFNRIQQSGKVGEE